MVNNIEITPLENWINLKIGKIESKLTREKLIEYQSEAFRNILTYAKERSSFYRDLLVDIIPKDIKSLESISKVPFTTSENIKFQGKQMICVTQKDIHRIVTLDTSGTTGSPKRIYFTKEDQELTIDFFHNGMSTFTDSGDKVLILLPGRTPGSIGDLLKIGLEGIIYGIVDNKDKVLDIILNQEITGIVGIPQQVYALCKSNKSEDIRNLGKLKFALLSTDYVSPAITETIRKSLGCKVYEHYGMTEMGLGGGVFCEALNGYHLREADMLFEIVDPITGRSLPDGEFGEVVFTTLTRKGMPLIRYKTGDISRFLIEPCTCGTVLRTLDRVQHRISSSITLKSGQIITMPMLENIIFDIKDILDFDAEISQKDKEVLTIFINAFGDENQITKNIVNAINNSSIGDFIKSNTLELEILNQGAKELDIKALRKRNILDKRYL